MQQDTKSSHNIMTVSDNNSGLNDMIIDFYSIDSSTKHSVPFAQDSVAAGFPSAAENYTQKALDLNELLIKHPSATFFVRVTGDSMINAGIRSGDILIVDRALAAVHNKIVVARINDEFTVKRIVMVDQKLFLMPENNAYKSIHITQDTDFEVWGVVTAVIHHV